MSDPLADRLAAAKRRLAEGEGDAAEIDAQHEANSARLDALDAKVAALASTLDYSLAEGPESVSGMPEAAPAPPPRTSDPNDRYLGTSERFVAGLRGDRAYLSDGGITTVRWDELLDSARIAEIDARLDRPVTAEAMDRADLISVGVCTGFGALAVLLDDQIDGFVKDRLCDLHKASSELGSSPLGKAVRRWDKEGKNLAFDYGGKGIGGGKGVHRVRSAGHDLLRPFQAINQIRSGQFEGHDWMNNVKIPISVDRPRPGFAPYRQVESYNEAVLVWLKHLASDFTTDKSLPLPGATFLHDVPYHSLRSIGAEAYKGGLNLRRVLISGMLPVAIVEAGIRLSVHIRTWRETGSVHLTPERKAKLDNMLLLTHGIVAAASAGKVAVSWGAQGPAALRHLNLAVLAAVARYALPVMVRHVRRDDPVLKLERNERELSAGWDRLLLPDGFTASVEAFASEPVLPASL